MTELWYETTGKQTVPSNTVMGRFYVKNEHKCASVVTFPHGSFIFLLTGGAERSREEAEPSRSTCASSCVQFVCSRVNYKSLALKHDVGVCVQSWSTLFYLPSGLLFRPEWGNISPSNCFSYSFFFFLECGWYLLSSLKKIYFCWINALQTKLHWGALLLIVLFKGLKIKCVSLMRLLQQPCAVCLEEFKARDELGVCPCSHTFHKK